MFVCGRKAALSRQIVEDFSLPRHRGGQGIFRGPSLDAHGTFLTDAARAFSASRHRTERISRHFDLTVSLTLLISTANRCAPAPTLQTIDDLFLYTLRVPN